MYCKNDNDHFFIKCQGNEVDDEEEPDLFQCGRCKQMFTVLQKYLRHKAAKRCSFFKSQIATPIETEESQVCLQVYFSHVLHVV